MNTNRHQIEVQGIPVEIVRKDIKNLHVGVYPPNGRVRVAAPFRLHDEAVRIAIVTRLTWIKRQRSQFGEQERQSRREMVSGETHYFNGRAFRLAVIERNETPSVRMFGAQRLQVCVRPGMSRAERQRVLDAWYRDSLRESVRVLIEKWQDRFEVRVNAWGIRKMKTRWGSCNAAARRIWLNLELAKKPASCLEFMLVHEMVHLLERHHNDRFREFMDRFMPQWRLHRGQLNRAPLSHENWKY